jgi:hypothetical protein
MDAMYRFLGYHTYPVSIPPVKPIKAQLPDLMNLILSDGKVTDLFIYFNRPESLKNMTYQGFYTYYTYSTASSDEIRIQIEKDSSEKRRTNGTDKNVGGKKTKRRKLIEREYITNDVQYNFIFTACVDTKAEEEELRLPSTTFTKVFKSRGSSTVYKLVKRKQKPRTLIRLETVPLRGGELAYIQMMLGDNPYDIDSSITPNRCPISYVDLRTVNGKTFRTFQEAAIESKLLQNPKYVTKQFSLICRSVRSPAHRRLHFAIWTKEDYPTMHLFNNGDYNDKENGKIYRSMVEDWIESIGTVPFAQTDIKNKFLSELESHLLEDSSRDNVLEYYGFPNVKSCKTEVEIERARYDKDVQKNIFEELQIKQPNNEEQDKFLTDFIRNFDTLVAEDDDNHDPIYMFLSGPGGTGKSTVLNKVAAYVRSKDHICKIGAATGLAATVYYDASTFHSLCKIPVVEENERELDNMHNLKLNLTNQRKELLLQAKTIILDELVYNHRECIESLVNCEELNFCKGKVIVGAGDFQQLLPILQNATKDELLGVSLSSSTVWNKFKENIYKLKTNMRLKTILDPNERYKQRIYGQILENVAKGSNTCTEIKVTKEETCLTDDEQIYHFYDTINFTTKFNNIDDDANSFTLNNEHNINVRDTAIKWLYNINDTSEFIPSMAVKSAVLANTNEKVDIFNKLIQSYNNGNSKTFNSTDSLADVTDSKGYLKKMLTEEQLNRKNHPSVPPHELTLKCNDNCMLMRNISVKHGLVNNARIRIMSFHKNSIRIETLGDSKQDFFLPRIKFKFNYTFGINYAILRKQFPLKLCYAYTIHKVQGQTMDKILLDVQEPVFCHGALYVAMSRIKKYDDIAFLVNEKDCGTDDEQNKPFIKVKNIVYKDILL